MDFFNKIEDLVNKLIFRLQAFCLQLVQKLTPQKVKRLIEKVLELKLFVLSWIKTRPAFLKNWLALKAAALKVFLASLNLKARLQATYQAALAKNKSSDAEVKGKLQQIKKIFMAPVLVVSHWLQGLTAMQSALLVGFTAASVLSIFSISFSGQRLLKNMKGSRAPASVIEDEAFPRPVYYKKQVRHLEFTAVRLPVFLPEVNELRSVDIDFMATLSNREAKNWLSKHEFKLRDFLIHQFEPVKAGFPLEDEGKEIIRQKLQAELNEFLKEIKIDAHVTELKLTYVLAN